MSDWDEWEDDWTSDAASSPAPPSRAGLVVVAVVVLVPFVFLVGGGANAIDALGPGLLAVAAFFAAVALTFLLVRRWLRRRLAPGESVWSDRR